MFSFKNEEENIGLASNVQQVLKFERSRSEINRDLQKGIVKKLLVLNTGDLKRRNFRNECEFQFFEDD